MSDVRHHGLVPAVQCIVLTVLHRYREHLTRLQAEDAAADRLARLRGERRPREKSRFVEAHKELAPLIGEEMRESIRNGQLTAHQQSRDGGFQEVPPEFWDSPESKGVLERALFKPFGKPLEYPIYLDPSELVYLRRSDLADKASPDVTPASSGRQKPLPASMRPEIIEVLKSLPNVRRAEQAKTVRARFQKYRITDRMLREAARSAPAPLGRPRKR